MEYQENVLSGRWWLSVFQVIWCVHLNNYVVLLVQCMWGKQGINIKWYYFDKSYEFNLFNLPVVSSVIVHYKCDCECCLWLLVISSTTPVKIMNGSLGYHAWYVLVGMVTTLGTWYHLNVLNTMSIHWWVHNLHLFKALFG